MNCKNPRILSDLPNVLLNDVQTSQQMFPCLIFVMNKNMQNEYYYRTRFCIHLTHSYLPTVLVKKMWVL